MGVNLYKGFIFIVGIMAVAILLMFGLKVFSLLLIALMAYHLNKAPLDDEDYDECMYGCPTDYKSYNRNKDFLDD